MRVLVFGDSITQGFWDTDGGWVQRLRQQYDTLEINQRGDRQPVLFNLGISADTSADVLRRIKCESAARAQPEETAFVIAIGINDTVYRGDELDCTPEQYRDNLQKILQITKEFSDKILFVGLTPAIDERVQPMPWSDTGKCYSTARITLFDSVLREFCAKHNADYVPILEAFQAAQQIQELAPDGIHPNNEGHQLIADLVRPALDDVLKS